MHDAFIYGIYKYIREHYIVRKKNQMEFVFSIQLQVLTPLKYYYASINRRIAII